MNKQEQIEEMGKIIDEMYWVYDTTADDIAEGLYNAGYRKTFTNEMVSDTQKAFKEGYEKGCEACAQSWDNGYNDGFEDGKEQAYKDCYDITRKETAKEILDKLNALMEQYHYKSTAWRNCANFIKETYGVEVEE